MMQHKMVIMAQALPYHNIAKVKHNNCTCMEGGLGEETELTPSVVGSHIALDLLSTLELNIYCKTTNNFTPYISNRDRDGHATQ